MTIRDLIKLTDPSKIEIRRDTEGTLMEGWVVVAVNYGEGIPDNLLDKTITGLHPAYDIDDTSTDKVTLVIPYIIAWIK